MGLMDLTELERLQGSFSLLSVIIFFIIGIKIISKYFEHKRKELIGIGFSIIFVGTGQIGHALSFIIYILFDFTTSSFLIIIFAFTFGLLLVICWIYSFSILIYPNSQKRLFFTFLIICILWEIFLIIYLLIDPEIIGILEGKFDMQFNFFGILLTLFVLISVNSTYGIFVYKSLKSDNPEIQWRGKFLLISMILIDFGYILDVLIVSTPISIVIARLFMILGAILCYLGWILPERIAKRLIKHDYRMLEESDEKSSDFEEFIKLLKSKPEKLTEKEITFYRERKICLICKGKVGRFLYMCPDCEALYCNSCAQALTKLENTCWVCNSPIDESKPVKPYKEEEGIEVEQSEELKK